MSEVMWSCTSSAWQLRTHFVAPRKSSISSSTVAIKTAGTTIGRQSPPERIAATIPLTTGRVR